MDTHTSRCGDDTTSSRSRCRRSSRGPSPVPHGRCAPGRIDGPPGFLATAPQAWFAGFLAGAALGPLVGGALLQVFWWGAAFLVGVPVMVLLLVLGPSLLPEYRDPHAGRMDLASAALALAAVLGIVYGLEEVAAGGLCVAPVVVTVLGLLVGVVGAPLLPEGLLATAGRRSPTACASPPRPAPSRSPPWPS